MTTNEHAPDYETSEPWLYEFWLWSVQDITHELLEGLALNDWLKWEETVFDNPWLLGLNLDGSKFRPDFDINILLIPHNHDFTFSMPVNSPMASDEFLALGHEHIDHEDCDHPPALCLQNIEEWFDDYGSVLPAVTTVEFMIRRNKLIAIVSHRCVKCTPEEDLHEPDFE